MLYFLAKFLNLNCVARLIIPQKMWSDLPELDNYVGAWGHDARLQCPLTWDGQQSADHSHKMVSQDQFTSTWSQFRLLKTPELILRIMINLIKSYIHVNLKYIICQIWEDERKKIGMITFKNVFSLGCKLHLRFYWLKLKWKKMENLYPVPSESWLDWVKVHRKNKMRIHHISLWTWKCFCDLFRWNNNKYVY